MPDRRSLLVAVAGLVLATAGAVWWWHGDDAQQPGGRVSSTPTARPAVGTTAQPVLAPARPGAPVSVRIPALGVTAPVVPVHAPGRTLVPPTDPRELGWWADGARPGARRGSALIAGHTVHTGGGALDDLERLRPGDAVLVRTDRGRVSYVVDRVRTYRKGRVAEAAGRLFSQSVPGRLVLVTCEDWDGTRYLSNVVVTATQHR